MKNSNVKTFSTFAFILLMSCSNLVASNYRPFYEHSKFSGTTTTNDKLDLSYNDPVFGYWEKSSGVSAITKFSSTLNRDTIESLRVEVPQNSSEHFITQSFFLVENAGQKFTFGIKQTNNSNSNSGDKSLRVDIINESDDIIGNIDIISLTNAATSGQNFTVTNTNFTGKFRLRFEFSINTSNGKHAFLFYNLQTDLSLLPVNYSALSATQVLGTAQIKWTTSMEENNSHFEIEHSVDGENWNQIGSVEGAGFSTEEMSYSYTDYNTVQGANIYRLKQVDYDGKFSYSNHLFVLIGNKSPQDQIQLIPNPSKGMVTIKGVDSPKVTVFNTAGTALYVSHNQSSLNLDFLQLGVYFLQIESFDGKVTRHRFLKD